MADGCQKACIGLIFCVAPGAVASDRVEKGKKDTRETGAWRSAQQRARNARLHKSALSFFFMAAKNWRALPPTLFCERTRVASSRAPVPIEIFAATRESSRSSISAAGC